jgi:Uma2 family endonuclease
VCGVSAAEKLVTKYAEYLALEAASPVKMQFVDGVAYAMAGGSPAHAQLAAEMIIALGFLLRSGKGHCRVFTADLKIHVAALGDSFYPDASVVCGQPEVAAVDANAVINPILLVEILSDSTESYDRGKKFRAYRRLPSLRHYILASQDEARLEHYRRNDDGTWTLTIAEAGAKVALPDLGGDLVVDDLYAGLAFASG